MKSNAKFFSLNQPHWADSVIELKGKIIKRENVDPPLKYFFEPSLKKCFFDCKKKKLTPTKKMFFRLDPFQKKYLSKK